MSTRTLALVVATRDRDTMLRRLLASALAMDDFERLGPEIVVADDGSRDRTRLVVDAAAERWPRVTYVRVDGVGKSAALNAAIRASSGALLAFVDDDVELDQRWLMAATAYFGRHDVAAAQGPILLPPEAAGDARIVAAVERWRTIPHCDLGPSAAESGSLIGANMIVSRTTFARVGLFDERLGPGASGACEDTELAERIKAAGGRIGWIPDAAVYHAVDHARLGAEFFRTLHERRGRSRVYYKQGLTRARVMPDVAAAWLRFVAAVVTGRETARTRALGRWYHYRALLAALDTPRAPGGPPPLEPALAASTTATAAADTSTAGAHHAEPATGAGRPR